MKLKHTTLVMAVLLAAALPARASDLEKKAREFIDHLSSGEFEAAAAPFDETMKKALPPPKLGATWQDIGAKMGTLRSIGDARRTAVGAFAVVILPCRFEKGDLDLRVTFDREERIAGFFCTPPEPAAAPPPWPPPYAAPARFEESAMTVGAEGYPLPGTLAVPRGEGPFPAVVLVHGSGPQDRDETVLGVKVFRDLAAGLASHGIAVLRYDKRTKVHGARWKPSMTVEDESIADAVAACAALRAAPRIDPKRVFLAGHSLGATVAPEIAGRDPALAGIVMLAPTARPLEDLIVEQGEYHAALDGKVTPEERAALDEIRAVAESLRKHALPPESQDLGPLGGGRVSAGYYYAIDAIDAVAGVKGLGRPVLILQGRRDCQVSAVRDFEVFRKALEKVPGVTLRLYPKANHLFVDGEGPSSAEEYRRPAHVADKVVADLADWILAAKPGG